MTKPAMTIPEQAVALLPCPFCGNELTRGSRRINPHARCSTEGCYGAKMPVVNLDAPDSVSAWNTRAAQPQEGASAVRNFVAQLIVEDKGGPTVTIREQLIPTSVFAALLDVAVPRSPAPQAGCAKEGADSDPHPKWKPGQSDRHPQSVEEWDYRNDPAGGALERSRKRLAVAGDYDDPRAPDQMALVLRIDLIRLLGDWTHKNAAWESWRHRLSAAPPPPVAESGKGIPLQEFQAVQDACERFRDALKKIAERWPCSTADSMSRLAQETVGVPAPPAIVAEKREKS